VTNPSPAGGDDELVRFARLVAHGLRNPLAVATGMIDLLARQAGDELDAESRQLIERSSAALRRAGDLVLALHRYTSATRSELAPAPVPLDEVLAAAADEVDRRDTTVVVDGELPTVTADGLALQRILCELLDNAASYGASTVAVSARADAEGVTITLDDDGPGIPADRHDAAFAEGERFGQLGDGFGLGLATVRTLTERHGGRVALDEAPGGGLRVTVRLPGSLGEQRP
jgi:signal transduction histidine kinase